MSLSCYETPINDAPNDDPDDISKDVSFTRGDELGFFEK